MKIKRVFLLAILMALLLTLPVQAQTDEYKLNIQKSFGYNNGENIRGTFKISVVGAQEQIQSVSLLLDGQEMAVLDAAPFTYTFDTGTYPAGTHQFSAIVHTRDGRSLTTPARQFRFLTAGEESEDMKGLMLPLLGLVGGLMLAMFLSQTLILRNCKPLQVAPGAPRKYGFKGGSVCKRCGRPFSLHWWSSNLIAGVYDRCDFCGKWGFYQRMSPADLAAAEAAELKQAQPAAQVIEKSDEEKLRELLDNSRYTRGD